MEFIEWLGLFVFLMIPFFRFHFGQTYEGQWYEAKSAELREMHHVIPSSGFLEFMWMVVFPMVSVSGFLYAKDGGEHYDVTLALYASNMLLSKIWTSVFFVRKMLRLSLLVCVLGLFTAISVEAFYCLDGQYISGGLYALYVFLMVYMCYLNYAFLSTRKERNDSKKDKKPKTASLKAAANAHGRQ